ncbi:hypothetical protein [Mesorhizobium sp. L48C026A00]|uniref:hypothetical protein n=1 Tax=Mesorhizobium sp. L48C026A00 TaxID=1287182 RepID=UPI0003FD3613|nr:hypothetical protein [Mesorhizobium sp. L48C026A00]
MSETTVSRALARAGLSRLKGLEPAEPVRRYEREHPGELIHLDTKKLGWIGSVASPGDILVRSTAISATTSLAHRFFLSYARSAQRERCRLPRDCRSLLRKPFAPSAYCRNTPSHRPYLKMRWGRSGHYIGNTYSN